jgi:hypothetical protein
MVRLLENLVKVSNANRYIIGPNKNAFLRDPMLKDSMLTNVFQFSVQINELEKSNCIVAHNNNWYLNAN